MWPWRTFGVVPIGKKNFSKEGEMKKVHLDERKK